MNLEYLKNTFKAQIYYQENRISCYLIFNISMTNKVNNTTVSTLQ